MRPILYPWHEWFEKFRRLNKDGEIIGYTLQSGRDYTCGSAAMSQMIRNEAREREFLVSIHEQGDELKVKARVNPNPKRKQEQEVSA